MGLATDLRATMEVRIPDAVTMLAEAFPDEVIEEALRTIKEEPVRRRTLPPDFVIWFVFGMSLLRERCIRAVVGLSAGSAGGTVGVPRFLSLRLAALGAGLLGGLALSHPASGWELGVGLEGGGTLTVENFARGAEASPLGGLLLEERFVFKEIELRVWQDA